MTLANLWQRRAVTKKPKKPWRRPPNAMLSDSCVCGHPRVNHLDFYMDETKQIDKMVITGEQPCPCGCTEFVKAKRPQPRARKR